MSDPQFNRPTRSGFARWVSIVFCDPPRNPRGLRWTQVVFRSLHVAAMGLLLGGLGFDVPTTRLFWPIWLSVASGIVLLGLELLKSGTFIYSGAGLGLWIKLLLLGLGHILHAAVFDLYLAATLVASIASHMPRAYRHGLLWRRGPHVVHSS